MRTVHLIVPEGFDDPLRPSGGNTFDRRVRDGLAVDRWDVRVHEVNGSTDLADAVLRIADGGVVLIDGLVASPYPQVLVPEADRLRLVVLMHMPVWTTAEGRVLSAAQCVLTTSNWTRRMLLERYALRSGSVRVAEPGADRADPAARSPLGGEFLAVASVTRAKGHDVLLDALATLDDLRWRCVCAGSLDRDQLFADDVRRRARHGAMRGRVRFAGAQTPRELARSYGNADLLVLPSRSETYGMVVTEALARGVPVVAADVGGVPEALGYGADGSRPGLLVPPDDPIALAEALRTWLRDADLRGRLRRAARQRRAALPSWSATTSVVAQALAEAA
ncbi:MAG TPA: glycosyltransferase family 4 protein [Gaiellaceae bacterium]|nr:glycosyltransferase family 4 protein [Gaiellaceae bacterium]